MRNLFNLSFIVFGITSDVCADLSLMSKHCSKCHGGARPKGGFDLRELGSVPSKANLKLWLTSLDYVKSGEMPPAKHSRLTKVERQRIVTFLSEKVQRYEKKVGIVRKSKPRRLNNRELANSVSDVLMIEDVGTHHPLGNLLGDTLHKGFDTNGEALGMSEHHLEQYIAAFRKIIDAIILNGEQPPTKKYVVATDQLRMTSRAQRRRAERANRTRTSIDFLDPRNRVYFANFETVPTSGRYRIRIRATAIDRGIYDDAQTGVYEKDPIRLRVHLGDRIRDFDLPDNKFREIKLDEWLAAGTEIRLSYPTDGLRFRGNGNFKFQYAIAHDYLKKNDPKTYAKVLKEVVPRSKRRNKVPRHWSHWTDYWQGPRPRLFSADVEGPIYECWPPKRQRAILGQSPKVENAESILRPLAERAWRRKVREGELTSIVKLIQSRAKTYGTIEAFKDGIVAILTSPSFLLINRQDGDPADRFATKLSYFLRSTIPDSRMLQSSRSGKLNTYEAIHAEIKRHFENAEADELLRELPHAWLQLDRINFMAPDPERFPLYDRKGISEDMVNEVLHFFRDAIKNNRPVPELLTANYTFLNADLAKVYGVANVPQDSKFRKHTFTDGRRGGFLGMGAFLTLTADSLTTSPIHRAVYVMENFLDIHPAPPPADVKIAEPDVRQAKTIKEILNAHRSNKTCASCHQTIDPYGYAFENFDAMGAWREACTSQIAPRPSRKKLREIAKQDRERAAKGLPPLPKPWNNKPVPVDSSSTFRNGEKYRDIVEYRKLMSSEVNRDRFVRCFIKKLLMYANGTEPTGHTEVNRILKKSAENGYRIIETIAAVVDSPLFRQE